MSKTLSSSSQLYEHIKFCTTTSCLTRKVRQKSKLMNFIYDVLNVALGKISHVYAIQFSDTHTFICNRDLLLTKLDQDLNNDFKDIIFIDVSKENVEPKQVKVPNSLIYLLNTQIYPIFIKENEKINSILFISQIPQCIISFTGWILEYQVIYVLEKIFESSIKEDFESQNIITNCLANQELKLYRIFLKKINNDHNSNKEFQRHMLLSFSCPVKIINSLNDVQSNNDIISIILNDTFAFRIEQNQSFWNKGWELEISDVCLPVVAL
ncbi:hypothetical protein RclHR1_15920002 [Rhizophagus clarus]|uniref:Uncharacterized protein n=1 Tax=Rhizophagus clarus TaxID=94130 RepID=A0A2Z6QGE7_9GLOM|nr:hypothetical protein RclHR1_15920002 [Rhizophagus clarus]